MSKTHEHWASRIGFIMATAGSAVGLGSLWRFPYVAGTNGGGAFVLLYLIFTFLIGLPVFAAELILGRKTQKSAILAYGELGGSSSSWRIVGWLNFITSLLIFSYYSVVSGWCLSYTLMSLTQFGAGKTSDQISSTFEILFQSPGINVFWFALYLLINLGIILSGVRKGIEHWSKILMPGLFIFLIIMFFYALTMPGFGEAVRFCFVPDFSALGASGVLNALGMSFFTLSVGLGILVTYGSYMKHDENIPYNGILIAAMTVFVSLIAALTIFPIVFSFGFSPSAGPGLVFQTLPVLFAKLPATILISTIFFALLLFAAVTSTISLLEVLVGNLMDVLKIKRLPAAGIAICLTFIIGVPSALSGSGFIFPNWEAIYGMNFFDTIEYVTASWFMPVAALFTTFFVGWKLKKEMTQSEFAGGMKAKWLAYPWLFMVRFVCPVVVIIIILHQAGLIKI